MSNQGSGRQDSRFRNIVSMDDYFGQDLARTHTMTRSEAAAAIDPALVDEQHRQLLEQGFIIIDDSKPLEIFKFFKRGGPASIISVAIATIMRNDHETIYVMFSHKVCCRFCAFTILMVVHDDNSIGLGHSLRC